MAIIESQYLVAENRRAMFHGNYPVAETRRTTSIYARTGPGGMDFSGCHVIMDGRGLVGRYAVLPDIDRSYTSIDWSILLPIDNWGMRDGDSGFISTVAGGGGLKWIPHNRYSLYRHYKCHPAV